MAPGDDGELGEGGHGASRPILEERPVAVGVAGYDPRGSVTHLVHHRVSEPVRRVEHLWRQLDDRVPFELVAATNPAREKYCGSLNMGVVQRDPGGLAHGFVDLDLGSSPGW